MTMFSHEFKKNHIQYTCTCSKGNSVQFIEFAQLWRLKTSENDTEFRNEKKNNRKSCIQL